jgi:ferredoxin, 2Fe-2S
MNGNPGSIAMSGAGHAEVPAAGFPGGMGSVGQQGQEQMPRITFVEHNGSVHYVDGTAGKSVMMTAVENSVPGIDADCGGECACATCHVFVDQEWLARVGAASEAELALLDFVDGKRTNSRLSCQIRIEDALDGLVVRLPEFQH